MDRPEPAVTSGEDYRTIPALLARQARERGSAAALAGPDGRLSYAELHDAAREVTRAVMATGLRPGEAAAIWAPNSARWIVTALGLLGAGAVLAPIGTRLRGPEAADILARSRSRLLFTVRGFLGSDYVHMLAESGRALPDLTELVLLSDVADPDVSPSGIDSAASPPNSTTAVPQEDRPAPVASWSEFLESASATSVSEADRRAEAVEPEDIADLLFTSGTTGAPKGVLATHGQALDVFEQWAGTVGLRPDDRYLLVNPFSHAFGLKAGIVACLLRAACMAPVARFDPAAVAELIDRERITVLTGPPTLFHDLVRAARPLPTVRLAGTGGATIPVSLIERIRDTLGIEHVFTAYGLTESIGVVSICPPGAPAELIATTVGKALPGSEIRIIGPDGVTLSAGATGEIAVRGANVMRGYLDNPAATADAIDTDGWLRTGDVGALDSEGYLRITDRLKDMFVVGGFNAYPAEIERILLAHPGIADVAVIGIPDDRLGEVAAAFLVPREPNLTEATVLDWARSRLAGYKLPRHIHIVDSLPRNASGKIRKPDLRVNGPASPHTA
ncbi:AMP-binding protein [Nocardia alni]|uniref:AMP-binding protein n=1 Tax=Nocardia alni TaxID=2815723 RepID=UPI0020B19C90|nr:AMP-binding protein [Nocardia alni]